MATMNEPLLGNGQVLVARAAAMPKSFSSCVLAEGASEAKHVEYKRTQRKLVLALLFAFLFMIVEVVGGIYAHSLAIITDAAHLLSDVSGFAVSAFAAVYAAKRSKEHFSYGYHRIEVLGALGSVLTVWLVTGVLLFEAVNRLITPEPVNGKIMFILALIGVVVNILLMLILGHDHTHGGHSCGGHDHSHHGHSHSHSHSNGAASQAPLLATVPETPSRERLVAAAGGSCGHGHSHSHTHSHDHNHEHNHGGEGGHCSDDEAQHAEHAHSEHSHSDAEEGHGGGCGRHSHALGGSGGATGDGKHSHDHDHDHARGTGGCGGGHSHDHSHGGGEVGASSAAGSHDRRNINLRGAVVHVIGDLVQSIGVAVAGGLIWYHQDDPRWYIADPICTFLFAGLVMWTTKAILRDIADVLMERVPRGLCIKTINEELGRIRGVEEIHDLHVWSLTPGIPLLCAHINLDIEADPTEVLHAITVYCRNMGIEHSTVQLVVNGRVCPCVTVPVDLEHGGSGHSHGHAH